MPVLARRARVLAAAGALALGAIAGTPAPAGAAGSVTVTPNPVPVAMNSYTPVQVTWTGQRARTLIFVSMCLKSTKDADFQVGAHCSPLAQVEVNGTDDGSGSATLPVFRGAEPSTDLPWGCFAPGDPIPPGVIGATSCFVRVTNDVVLNNDAAVEVAVSVTGAGDPVDRGVLGAPVAAGPVTAPTGPAGGSGAGSGPVIGPDGVPISFVG